MIVACCQSYCHDNVQIKGQIVRIKELKRVIRHTKSNVQPTGINVGFVGVSINPAVRNHGRGHKEPSIGCISEDLKQAHCLEVSVGLLGCVLHYARP
jgi:hypothetical protein